ncbi:MAG: ATP-binding protein [Bacteroidia bacterium]
MKIKARLTLGVGLLFFLIILLAGVSAKYINALTTDTENILVANYNTLDYSRQMLLALDEDMTTDVSIKKFSNNLRRQQNNITEVGERELTERLANDYEKLKLNPNQELLYVSIRKDLTDLMLINMQAIERKSNIAKQTAKTANMWIAVTGTLCFLIAFSLLINLPRSIANPIKEITRSIKEIASQKYSERVHFESSSEFGDLASAFNTMAEKLEEYDSSNLAKLLMEKKRIETLINNMHDPVIGLDENKRILFVNDEALKISGLKSNDVIGKKAQDIAVTNDLIRSLIKDLMLPEKNSESKINQPMKIYADNKESYFEKELLNIEITPTGESTKQLIGHVIVLRNITPFKELDFAKTNFIATVSHELKTPISSILMSLKLLEDNRVGNVNEEQKLLVQNIKDDSERLLKITSELLNITQVETGKIQLTLQQTNPKEIIQYAVESTRALAEQSNIKIEIKAANNLPQITADSEKTSWVLTNLITNAIRYSYENSKVIVEVKEVVDGQPMLNFSVQDFGKGIDSKYRDKIFDRYFQVPGSSKSGTGLGLAISKEFINAQGGKIWMESELTTGSKFSFQLAVASV